MTYYPSYVTYLPSRVRLSDGSIVVISWDDDSEDNVLLLYIDPGNARYVCENLRLNGYRDAVPAKLKRSPLGGGVLCSVSRVLMEPWEHHVRVYYDGFVESEVEVSREYLEHLSGGRKNVIYETLSLCKDACGNAYIYHRPSGKWVVDILENQRVEIMAPSQLTRWKPLAMFGLMFFAMGAMAYVLHRSNILSIMRETKLV